MLDIIDDRTPHMQLELPHPRNLLGDDVQRLRRTLLAIDGMLQEKASSNDLNISMDALEQAINGLSSSVSTLETKQEALRPPSTLTTTRTSGRITSVTEDGVTTTITYNADGTVNTVAWLRNGKTRTETYAYSAGALTGMTATEV